MLKKLLITMALVAMVSYLGCNDAGDPVSIDPPDDDTLLTKDDSVLANCQIVFDALVDYATVNNGVVPASMNAELPDGRTLVDFLPGAQLLVNPYSGLRTEPDHVPGAAQGQTGYVTDGTRFWVNGVGETPALNLILLEYDPNDSP